MSTPPPTVSPSAVPSSLRAPTPSRVRATSMRERDREPHTHTPALSSAPPVLNRAIVTCDPHGVIVCANAAVFSFFGYEPDELVDLSLRELIVFLPKARAARHAVSASERFSSTDVWQHLIADVTSTCVLSGRHKDGSLRPMWLSCSISGVGNDKLYSIMFENVPSHRIVWIADDDGVVQSVTHNVSFLLGMDARTVCGRKFADLLQDSTRDPLKESWAIGDHSMAKHRQGGDVEITIVNARGEPTVCTLQVKDVRHNVAFVTRVGPISTTIFEPRKGSLFEVADQDGSVYNRSDGRLGAYDVLPGDLGNGQCGMVRRAVHRSTATEVAVKTLSKEHFKSIGLSWPGREPDILKQLCHPNIAQLFDVIHGHDRIYLILELVKGGELLTHCFSKGPLPEAQARALFRELLCAVDYLHRKGVVHRDIKLENCLLDESRTTIKLIDFGLGNFFLDGPLKTSCGSADYAAPELFTSSKYHGPPVDVWAMGVVLFAMLSGEFPFADIQATMDGEYAWPASVKVSASVSSLVADIFELNPDLRLTVDQIRRHDWVNQGFTAPTARPPLPPKPGPACWSMSTAGCAPGVRCDLLCYMERELGFAVESVMLALLEAEINHMTAVYKMLLKLHPHQLAEDPEALAVVAASVAQAERQHLKPSDLSTVRSNVRMRTYNRPRSSTMPRPSTLPEPAAPVSVPTLVQSNEAPVVSSPSKDRRDKSPRKPNSGGVGAQSPELLGGILLPLWRLRSRVNSTAKKDGADEIK